MQAACDIAFDYAHQRKAFGERIGTFQVRVLLGLVAVAKYRKMLWLGLGCLNEHFSKRWCSSHYSRQLLIGYVNRWKLGISGRAKWSYLPDWRLWLKDTLADAKNGELINSIHKVETIRPIILCFTVTWNRGEGCTKSIASVVMSSTKIDICWIRYPKNR